MEFKEMVFRSVLKFCAYCSKEKTIQNYKKIYENGKDQKIKTILNIEIIIRRKMSAPLLGNDDYI